MLNEFVGFHLRLAQDASFRSLSRLAGVRGLKPGHFTALTVIHHDRGISLSDLARAIGRDKSSVTPLVRELEREGLIQRMASRTDRRSLSLALTRKGEAMRRRLLGHAEANDRRIEAIVGPEKKDLLRLLRMLGERLD